jgi:ascorbate-specific PTS system EIIC-type component UlaA
MNLILPFLMNLKKPQILKIFQQLEKNTEICLTLKTIYFVLIILILGGYTWNKNTVEKLKKQKLFEEKENIN